MLSFPVVFRCQFPNDFVTIGGSISFGTFKCSLFLTRLSQLRLLLIKIQPSSYSKPILLLVPGSASTVESQGTTFSIIRFQNRTLARKSANDSDAKALHQVQHWIKRTHVDDVVTDFGLEKKETFSR